MRNGLKILSIADACVNLALGMIGPIYAIFVANIGGDILDVGWAYFAFTFTSGVVLYLISTWEDRVRHKEKLVVLGYAINTVGCVLYLFTDTQQMLLITQVVLGVGVAVVSPAFDALYSHFVKNHEEASDWGAWEAMGYLVAAIASVVGSFVAAEYGFAYLFIGMAIISLVGTLASLALFSSKDYLARARF